MVNVKFIFFTLLSFSMLFAKVNIGDTLPPLNLVDQFDNKVKIGSDTTLIISFQKNVSSKIQAYLSSKSKHYLEDNNMLYLSDMSAAPTFMIKLFGIPKMKKFMYKVALIYDEKIAENIQRESDKVTVIKLNHKKIVNIDYINPEQLNKALDN